MIEAAVPVEIGLRRRGGEPLLTWANGNGYHALFEPPGVGIRYPNSSHSSVLWVTPVQRENVIEPIMQYHGAIPKGLNSNTRAS